MLGEDLCATQPNTLCVNTEGSYLCDCVPGYFAVNGKCLRESLGNVMNTLYAAISFSESYSTKTSLLLLSFNAIIDCFLC